MQIAILKLGAVQPYLLMDRNHFRADTSRHWKEFICKTYLDFERNAYARFLRNSYSGFRGDAITVKIAWPYLSTDRNHIRADTTRPLGEHLRQVSKKNDQWSRRCNYGRMDIGRYHHEISSTKKIRRTTFDETTPWSFWRHFSMISFKMYICLKENKNRWIYLIYM